MSEKIEEQPFNDGDCVFISAVGALGIAREVGIILSHVLVEMDDDLFEYLYTVLTPAGIDDYWAYEVKLVNTAKPDYNNNITHNKKVNIWNQQRLI